MSPYSYVQFGEAKRGEAGSKKELSLILAIIVNKKNILFILYNCIISKILFNFLFNVLRLLKIVHIILVDNELRSIIYVGYRHVATYSYYSSMVIVFNK